MTGIAKACINTCHVFILTPVIVSWNVVSRTVTLETQALVLSFPKLPMLIPWPGPQSTLCTYMLEHPVCMETQSSPAKQKKNHIHSENKPFTYSFSLPESNYFHKNHNNCTSIHSQLHTRYRVKFDPMCMVVSRVANRKNVVLLISIILNQFSQIFDSDFWKIEQLTIIFSIT